MIRCNFLQSLKNFAKGIQSPLKFSKILKVTWCHVKQGMTSLRRYGNLDIGKMNFVFL